MDKPIIAANSPIKVELEKGREYYFCVCGRSANQPFCDGGHASTTLKPRPFTAEQDGEAYLCRCKHTGNQPFCDGTHKRFSDAEVGKPGGTSLSITGQCTRYSEYERRPMPTATG